jgi:uncharacterized protein with GYD domain
MAVPTGGGKGAYFFLWTLTDAGVRDAQAVGRALRRASAMARRVGGECHLYVSTGGPYALIGVAHKIDDAKAVRLQQAIDALGFMKTTLVKTTEFSLAQYDAHARDVTRLKRINP